MPREIKMNVAGWLHRRANKILGYEITDYGLGYSDGWRAGAREAVRKETIDELIASATGPREETP